MPLFGEQHLTLVELLTIDWWSNGPPLAVIQGLPGIGKTEIADHVVERLKKLQPRLPIVLFDCPESKTSLADDLLLTLAEELEAEGDRDLMEQLERGEDSHAILGKILVRPRLIVLDEAQRLSIGSTRAVSSTMATLLEGWSHTPGAEGRLLLLSSREFEHTRWTERATTSTLLPLKPQEAEVFLLAELTKWSRRDAVPDDRLRDVVTWLGCNPRAMKVLVTALGRATLDELIGLAPEAWEARDRLVSPELLRGFEKAVLERAENRLDATTRAFLRRLSVLRRPVNSRGLEALTPDGGDMTRLRSELIARFMLEFRRGHYEMHPVLRDTVRSQMTEAERLRAHAAAGRYHAAPFRARRMVGGAEQLGGRFIEARYHFTMAESEQGLAEISQRFEAHFRTTLRSTSPVPSDPQERDERISLLSALLQARGAKGLEYHLARCLLARQRPGDLERALPHARRATGPQAPADAWVLRIRLESEIFGAEAAAKVAIEGIDSVPPTQGLFALYQAAAEILAQAGKPDEAIELLRQGIKEVPPTQGLFALYQAAGSILNRCCRTDEAIDWLIRGRRSLADVQNGYRLAEAAVFVAFANDRLDKLAFAGFGQPQLDLLAIITALGDGDPARAGAVGKTAIARHPTYFALYAQTAFAWLCAGDPAAGKEALESFPGSVRYEPGNATTWLAAFIALELGKTQEARTYFEIYIDRHLDVNEVVDRSLLLRLWDSSAESLGGNTAFYFPWLPPVLTGLNRTVVRRQHGGPVLTEPELRGLREPKEGMRTTHNDVLQPTSQSSFDAERIIQAMRPDGWYGLYVLGCYDQLKTVYAQQCRALTLVHALLEMGELKQDGRLAVIGGGAAGVMAAAAAATKDVNVILFERAENLLPLQRQNTKRYLHPHVYDWPAAGSLESCASLPLLDWQADLSNHVAAQIVNGLQHVREHTGRIDIRVGQTVQDLVRVSDSDQTDRIQIIGSEGDINELVDTAIIAIGFGVEPRHRLCIATPPYWEDDGLGQTLGASRDRPHRILVSGAGDGALIDILRATLQDFSHEEVLGLLPRNDRIRGLEADLQAVERKARTAEILHTSPVNLHDEYSRLSLADSAIDALKARIRKDTEVWFNFTSVGRYTLGSAMLNRILVSMLCSLRAVKPKLGRLEENSIVPRQSGDYSVTWRHGHEAQIFDRIVIRHGPPNDYLGSVFPDLADACAPLRGKLRDLGLTGSLDEKTRRYFKA